MYDELTLIALVFIGSMVLLRLIYRNPNPFIPDYYDARISIRTDPEYIKDLATEIENHGTEQEEFEFEAVHTPATPREPQPELDAEQLLKMEKKRNNVLAEFLATEQTYVHCLNILSSHFINPIRKQQLIEQSTFNTIFNSIEIIKGVNETFLTELEKVLEQERDYEQNSFSPNVRQKKTDTQTSKLAELLLHFAHSFKLYTSYISSYRLSQSTLAIEKANNRKLKLFLAQQQKRLTVEKNRITDLEGYLITPVQRLPRYRLLLEDLIKTVPRGNDYNNLVKATELIRQVTNFCNEKEREFERQARFLMIRREIKYPELKPSRRYVGEEVGKGISCTDGPIIPNKPLPTIVPCDIYLFNDILVVRKKSTAFFSTGILQIGLHAKDTCPQTGKVIDKVIVSPIENKLSFTITCTYQGKEPPSMTKFVCTDENQCEQLRNSIESCTQN
jgi:hypothetical protein